MSLYSGESFVKAESGDSVGTETERKRSTAPRILARLSMAAAATMIFTLAFILRWFPLGVPDEFEIPRLGPWDLPITPWRSLLPTGLVALALIALVGWSMGRIEGATRRTFLLTVVGVIAAGGAFQILLEIASPMGLTKWASLYHGFRHAARTQFSDVSSVFANHAEVAASFEPNHISANPAGWIVLNRALLSFFDRHPAAAEAIWKFSLNEVDWSLGPGTGPPGAFFSDRAAMTVIAYLNRGAGLLVGLPLAWLVRQRYSRSAVLASVALAMLVPAAVLVAPGGDSVYPTFATLIVAVSYYASARRSWLAAALAGVLSAIGMLFSLSFLVVAALAAVMVTVRALQGTRPTIAAAMAAPAAWALMLLLVAVACGHRAWESWRINLEKNAEFNRFSGCSYLPWVPVNLLEFAVGMGLPASMFLLARIASGVRHWRSADGVCAAWALTLALLALAGSNRGEVSRLWLFLMPLGAALASEWLAQEGRVLAIKVAVGGLLSLEAFQSCLLSRELLLLGLWQAVPHDAQALLDDNPGRWIELRRVTDEEYERRTGKRAGYLDDARNGAIRPAQTVYLWSARESAVGAAADPTAYAALAEAAEGHDAGALNELVAAGLIMLVPQNTRAFVVQTGSKVHLVRISGKGRSVTAYVGVGDVHREKRN